MTEVDGMGSYHSKNRRSSGRDDRCRRGMTIIELLIAASIISILAVIGVIGYQEFVYRGQVSQAAADICRIEMRLQRFFAENVAYPPTLAEIGENNRLDPWGNPYQYWPITGDKNQKVRKDKNLHPINTDFDLCSIGRDGVTNLALTAHASQDDIIRANNGRFVALASKY
jgi:general secretion pathway protein G